MRPSIRFVLAGTAATLPAFPAFSAEEAAPGDYLPADILVVGQRDGYASEDGSSATKTATALIDVPQTIAVITEDQLDDQAITQLADALRYVPGVTLDTGEGHRDQVFIRGQASTADFTLDGLRDDGEYYRPLYNVARIEVLKGANALIFGRGGGGGVINRVSKVADPVRSSAGFDAGVDSFGAYSLAADFNQPLSPAVAGRITTAYEEFGNHRDVYSGRFFGVSPTVFARLGEDTRLSAFYTYDYDRRVTDRGIPSLGGEPLEGFDKTFFGDPDFNRATNQAHIARLRLDHAFSGNLVVNFTGQFADYDKFYANAVPIATNGTTITLDGYSSATDRRNWIGQGNLVWTGETGALAHTVLAGFEIGNQDTVSDRFQIDFGSGAAKVTIPLARRLSVPSAGVGAQLRGSVSELDFVSGYVQDQLAIGEHLQLIAGVRYDEFRLDTVDLVAALPLSRTDSRWSPRFGVVFKPRESLSLYASYATSFLPQVGDQFTVLNTTTASLAPESFENLEAGFKWAPQPDLFLTAAAFRLDRSNTRAVDPARPGFSVLTGKSRVTGFELGLVGRLASNWQANLGYTYLDGKIRSDTASAPAGRRLPQVPENQFSAWTRFDPTDRLGFGAGVIYQGEQFASVSNAVTLPDWVRVDAAAFFEVNDRLSLQLNLENLFDADYYSSAHGDNNIQPGEPLSVRLGVKVTL